MDQQIRHATAPGGERIAYAAVGDGPLLVLAAWWTSHLEFDWQDPGLRDFVETLAHRHTVVRYDRPGVGLSSRGDRPYDLDSETEYLNTVIDAARRDGRQNEVDLLGISCGGPGSVRVAAERPDVIRSLILFASYANGHEIIDDATQQAITDLVRVNWGMGSQSITSVLLPGAEPDAIRRFNRSQRDTATSETAAALLGLTFTLDASGYTGRVDVPTLVLHRAHDLVIGCDLGRDLADRIAGAEFRELEGKAHVPWTGDCSAALGHIERFLTGEQVGGPPVRELATVCFIDIVDSTRMLSALGDARWRERLDHLGRLVADEATRRNGNVLKDTGDGAMLTFAMPGDGFDFAQVIRSRSAAIDLPLRIGLHTGEVELRGDDITGITVVIASRVADAACPGQILATRTAAELAAGSGVRFVDAGSHDLKGVAGERQLVDVAPVDAVGARDETHDPGDDRRAAGVIRFGEFELDPAAFELRRDGVAVEMEPQVFDVLRYLAARAGELVTKEQLLDDVWGDRFVSESSLSSRIRSARVAVGDDGSRQVVIKTVHGRGFRFIAELHRTV
ncbi:alpha/beta fold hydrolase [Ilumatobacter sp.]|uniref:alpha/beta fold hydrolase n=1 Tax=Ilumatobacter sp. TaxID=1967498 RepID=UPI003AF7B2EE